MKTLPPKALFFSGLITSLLISASRAAVYPYAEYRLGEAGSLSGTDLKPQDSSGANRHFFGGHWDSNNATVSTSVSPAAIGSTASLDTSVAGDQFWTGGSTSFSTLPKDNFAFGIFAKSEGSWFSPVFSLGDSTGALTIVLTETKWQLRIYRGMGSAGVSGNFTSNAWTHLAVIRKGGETRFYVDGVDQGTPFNDVPTHGTPLLGKNFTGEQGYYFDGLLDEARVITFSADESVAKILGTLRAGAITSAFVTVGNNASFQNATLSPAETSVFRINNGQLLDVAQVLDSNGLSVGGTAPNKHLIQITTEGLITLGRYPLIDYTGTIGGQGFAGLGLAPLPPGVTATLEDNLANSTIDLVITGTPGLTWTGSNSNIWDVGTTNNWVLDGTTTSAPFLNSKQVTFDGSTAATVNFVEIAETVSPSVASVDGSEDYTFSGSGIGGTAALLKNGTGTLTLTNTNTNSGTTRVNGGTLSLGDGTTNGSLGSGNVVLGGGRVLVNQNGDVPFLHSVSGTCGIGKLGAGRLFLGEAGSTNTFSGSLTIAAGEVVAGRADVFNLAAVNVASGATFDVAGFTPGAGFVINGIGVNGRGALKNSGGEVRVSSLTLGSDASIGDGLSMYAEPPISPSLPGPRVGIAGNHTLTKTGSGDVSFTRTDIKVRDLVIDSGRFILDESTAITNENPGTITINGGSLDFANSGFVNMPYFLATNAKPITLNGGEVSVSGGPYQLLNLSVPIQLDGPGGTLRAERFPRTMTTSGPIPPANLSVSGVVSGSGALNIRGYGAVTLTQAPAYTGDTEVLGEPDGIPYYAGRLALMASGLNDSSTVKIGQGAVLELGFSGTDTVDKLFINGIQQPPGVYNASHVSGRFAGTGSLTVTNGVTGTPYELWAYSHGLPGNNPEADPDGDSISNGIEFVIGGDPSGPNSDSRNWLPQVNEDGTHLVVTFARTDVSQANYPPVVKYGTSFDGEWDTAVHGVNGVTFEVEDDEYGVGRDRVTVRIPLSGNTKLFARVEVDIP